MADYSNSPWHTDRNATVLSGEMILWNVWAYNERGDMIILMQTPSYSDARATVSAHNARLVY